MAHDLFDSAVDEISKDLDGLLMAGLKVRMSNVFSKESMDKIPESRWPSLLNRCRSQLPLPASDQPSSPLDTTISEGSQKSEDGSSSMFDEPAQMRDGIERLPLAVEDEFKYLLSIKLPTQDTSRKEVWKPLTYKTDDNQRESRINADALEYLGFDLCGQIHQLIEVPIRLGNSEDWQKYNLRILPVEHFQDCDILLGQDVPKCLRCITNPIVPGLTKSKLKQHNSLDKQEDNERGFKHKSGPNIEYDNVTSSYGMPPDDKILMATRAGKNKTGTMKDQAALTAGWLRDWFPPGMDPTNEAFRTADKICTHRGDTMEDQISFTQELIGIWFPSTNSTGQPKRPKN